jgi:hypothetical protein
MAASMKALIASDGSTCADAAFDDLKRAGLPGEAEAAANTRKYLRRERRRPEGAARHR